MKDGDVAYLAAIVDVLAILRTRKAHGTQLPMVAVHGPQLPALRLLASRTGTKVSQVDRSYNRMGCTEHCPEDHIHVVSVSYKWSVTGVKATILLHNLLPYMRLQGALARELILLGAGVGYKGNVVDQMQRLGWRVPELKAQPRARAPLKIVG